MATLSDISPSRCTLLGLYLEIVSCPFFARTLPMMQDGRSEIEGRLIAMRIETRYLANARTFRRHSVSGSSNGQLVPSLALYSLVFPATHPGMPKALALVLSVYNAVTAHPVRLSSEPLLDQTETWNEVNPRTGQP